MSQTILHPFDAEPSSSEKPLSQTGTNTVESKSNATLARLDPSLKIANTPPHQLRNRLQVPSVPSDSASSPAPNTSTISDSSAQPADTPVKPHPSRRTSGPGGRYLLAESEEVPPKRWTNYVGDFLEELYKQYSPSLTLENKGSIARDHLANERTYLAWLRSSLSLITVGVAITQLFRLQSSVSNGTGGSTPAIQPLVKVSELGRPLGGSFIALGIMFLWLGTSRYFHNQSVLSYGQFPASRGSVILATVTVMGVLLACFIIVVLQGRTQ